VFDHLEKQVWIDTSLFPHKKEPDVMKAHKNTVTGMALAKNTDTNKAAMNHSSPAFIFAVIFRLFLDLTKSVCLKWLSQNNTRQSEYVSINVLRDNILGVPCGDNLSRFHGIRLSAYRQAC